VMEKEKARARKRYRVAMVGGKTSTIGFRALGLDTYTVVRPEEAEDVWKRVDLEKYAVIFVTEPVYERLASTLALLEEEGTGIPVVTVVPSVAVSEDRGITELREKVERAVGVDILDT
jgi:vacuolar-type H+-ATPase subunit F/Vma7